ncbi:rho GTPase-activating protein 24, partial [Elysia marginata]
LPGRQSVIKDIISRFERGHRVSFEQEETDVHAVASVLKAFLRDLPDSIIPCALFQRFMNFALRFQEAVSEGEKSAVVQELADSMSDIPVDNYVILKYICRFLQDVFALEYSSSGTVAKSVPTADLLRMSTMIDVPPVIPLLSPTHPASHVAELEGIQLVVNQPPPTNGDSLNCDLSPLTSTSSIPDSDSVFLNSPQVQDEIARRPSLLRVLSQPAGSSRSLPASPTTKSPPIAPQRKSKIRRGRVSDRRRPEGIVVLSGQGVPDGPKSPRGDRSPNGVNSEDVIAALAKANLRHVSNNEEENSKDTLGGDSIDIHTADQLSPTEREVGEGDGRPVPSVRRHRPDGLTDNRVKFLQQQVDQLTEELAQQKKRQRQQVSKLQAQLSDITEKYEHRIATLETQHKSATERLEAKLLTERDSCAQAVAYTIKLKEDLHRYQMQYGELPF